MLIREHIFLNTASMLQIAIQSNITFQRHEDKLQFNLGIRSIVPCLKFKTRAFRPRFKISSAGQYKLLIARGEI